MTKPVVTLRDAKGEPLSYTELDTNFTNLRDATVSLQGGAGGTLVVSDLNGSITILGGTGVSVAGDDTLKTITITNTYGSGTLNSDTIQIGADTTLDIVFEPPTGYTAKDLVFTTDGLTMASQVGANVLTGDSDSLTLRVRAADYGSTEWTDDEGLDTGASIVIDGDNIAITAGTAGLDVGGGDDTLQVTGQLVVDTLDSTAITALTPQTGSIIFNTSTSKFQGYDGSTWNDLH